MTHSSSRPPLKDLGILRQPWDNRCGLMQMMVVSRMSDSVPSDFIHGGQTLSKGEDIPAMNRRRRFPTSKIAFSSSPQGQDSTFRCRDLVQEGEPPYCGMRRSVSLTQTNLKGMSLKACRTDWIVLYAMCQFDHYAHDDPA
jgi:hypothetical protein